MTKRQALIIEFSHGLGDTVYIKPLTRTGRVVCAMLDSDGLMYRVRFFDGPEPSLVYFFEDELEATDEGEKQS